MIFRTTTPTTLRNSMQRQLVISESAPTPSGRTPVPCRREKNITNPPPPPTPPPPTVYIGDFWEEEVGEQADLRKTGVTEFRCVTENWGEVIFDLKEDGYYWAMFTFEERRAYIPGTVHAYYELPPPRIRMTSIQVVVHA